MFRLLSFLILNAFLAVSLHAQSNLAIIKYLDGSQVPASFRALVPQNIVDRTYLDDEMNPHTEKVFYAATQSFTSSYRIEDLKHTLNPANGKLGTLFEHTSVEALQRPGTFSVSMLVTSPIKDFKCDSSLNFKQPSKNTFVYNFVNFNIVFNELAIKIELEEVGSEVKIKLTQLAVLKGTSYAKLKRFFAVGTFEKSMKENIKKFKEGMGGR